MQDDASLNVKITQLLKMEAIKEEQNVVDLQPEEQEYSNYEEPPPSMTRLKAKD